ncbi:MAG: glycosyltransferase [Bacteroidia bacterium]|nr:glycosyltransferase [Bacteroidia bacterium]
MTTALLGGTLAYLALYALVHFWLVVALARRRASTPVWGEGYPWPHVAVLVPARNEAHNLDRCLASLLALDYPPGKLTLWVGDDRSTDGTAECIRRYATRHAGVHYIAITTDLPGQRGKQNVLAQLAHHVPASTEFLLVTDADIAVPPTWAKALVSSFTTPSIALVSGPTVVEAPGWFARLQGLDWRYGVGAFQALAERGLPVTAVGNNMAYRHSHYRALGGYEALPFSITEDYRLFQAFRAAGYGCRFVFAPSVANRSAPIVGLRALLHQRKRWYKGGLEAPFHARAVYYLQAVGALLPIGLALGGHWAWLGAFFALKWLADGLLIATSARRLGLPVHGAWLVPWGVYFSLSLLVLPLYFILPWAVVWKGRRY